MSEKFTNFKDYFRLNDTNSILDKIPNAKFASSGALVGKGLVLTVAHAVGENEIPKILVNERIIDAEILEKSIKYDVMLLKYDENELQSLPFLEISSEAVTLGQKLYGVSFPLADRINFRPTFYNCDITSVKIDNDPHLFQINCELSEGCSGMVLVNDTGQVVGVVNSRAAGQIKGTDLPNDWNYATHSSYIIRLFQEYFQYSPTNHFHVKQNPEELAKLLNKTVVIVLACG